MQHSFDCVSNDVINEFISLAITCYSCFSSGTLAFTNPAQVIFDGIINSLNTDNTTVIYASEAFFCATIWTAALHSCILFISLRNRLTFWQICLFAPLLRSGPCWVSDNKTPGIDCTQPRNSPTHTSHSLEPQFVKFHTNRIKYVNKWTFHSLSTTQSGEKGAGTEQQLQLHIL